MSKPIKFVLEGQPGTLEPVHLDFVFHCEEALSFLHWRSNFKGNMGHFVCSLENLDELYRYGESDADSTIPVGSLDFVEKYCMKFYGTSPLPIHIPPELMKPEYLLRRVWTNGDRPAGDDRERYFVKESGKFKGLTDEVPLGKIRDGNDLFVSELMDIDSEWRGFVYRGRLADVRRYCGRFNIFPSIPVMERMVHDYGNSPEAYTLDVAVLKSGDTAIVEVHPFFSCGLYGFEDYPLYIDMLRAGHRYMRGEKVWRHDEQRCR